MQPRDLAGLLAMQIASGLALVLAGLAAVARQRAPKAITRFPSGRCLQKARLVVMRDEH